jgi:hypothetical protein
MPKVAGPVTITEKVVKLKAEKDQHEKEVRELSGQAERLRMRLREIDDEIHDLTNPWMVGDIVQDELGVMFRVTKTRGGAGPSGLMGIRLNKNGTEAYPNPRSIYAKQPTKVVMHAEALV